MNEVDDQLGKLNETSTERRFDDTTSNNNVTLKANDAATANLLGRLVRVSQTG